MPKKKVTINVEETPPNNIVCEVENMPPKGEPVLKVEPHEPKKTRKPLSQESLDKLKLAREAAYKKRMELKAEREKPKPIPIEEEPEPISPKKKTKSRPKKPIVIMEQSSSGSDEEQQVIYVKKKSNKNREKPSSQATLEQPPIATLPPQPQQPQYHQPTNQMHPRYGYNPHFSQFSQRRPPTGF